jgi:shikimate kinase
MKNRMDKKNVALIGMPGCFKTTVGKILAGKLSYAFYDTDALYEEIHGEAVPAAFKQAGEENFRRREAVIIAAVSQKKAAVISTGGGAILRADNTAALKANSIIIQLYASVQTIYERIKNDTSRPLFADMSIQSIEKLYATRKGLYQAAADFPVDTENKIPEQIAEEIIVLLHK